MQKTCLTLIILFSSLQLYAQGDRILRNIEAKPYGGWKALREFIMDEMVYPRELLEQGKEGMVILLFEVTENGRTRGVEIMQSPHPSFSREAIRIYQKVLWTPAIRFDEFVASKQKMEVLFDVSKYRKWCRKRNYDSLQYPYTPVDTTNHLYESTRTSHLPRVIFDDSTQTIHRFIKEELKYPEEAWRRNIGGKMTLRFVVEQDGRLSNIYPLKPLGGGCTEEAIRLIKLMKWYPAIHEGMAVRTVTDLDVIFVLPSTSPPGHVR